MAQKVTIIGLGAVGASLGLALRKSGDQLAVVGMERDSQLARRAQQSGAVDRVELWAENACRDAALVILSEPISRGRDMLAAVARTLPRGCVVTSTAPLIAPLVAWADELLPDGVSFVAGHPILDPAKLDDAPSADLFQRAQYCIVPSTKASPTAMDLIAGLAAMVGAQPFFLDAAEHDGLVTALEGLPGLLGAALASAAVSASSWRDMRRMAGPTFARATAGANEEPVEVVAALRANRENLARWLEIYCAKLDDVRAMLLADDAETLTKMLTDAHEARDRWLQDQRSGNWDNVVQMPKVTMGTLLGNLLLPQRLTDEERRRKR